MGASLLALGMRPWRRGTAAARNVEEGGLRDRQLRHPLHQRYEVDDRREGLVRKVRIDPPWSCTCAKVAGEVIHHLASVRGAVRISSAFSSMFGFERGTVRGLHGWQGWVFDSHRSSPSFARMRLESLWRAAWPEAGRVLPTCRDEGGSRKRCVRRAQQLSGEKDMCGAGGRGEKGLPEKWKKRSSAGEGWLAAQKRSQPK